MQPATSAHGSNCGQQVDMRSCPDIPTDLSVVYTVGNDQSQGIATAICESGIRFAGEKMLAIGTEITLELRGASLAENVVKLNAVVRDCSEGVTRAEFMPISPVDRQLILEIIYQEIMRRWH